MCYASHRATQLGFQGTTLVIDRSPEVVHLAVDLHVDLIEVPTPMANAPHRRDPLAAYVGCEKRPDSVPYVDGSLLQEVEKIFRADRLLPYVRPFDAVACNRWPSWFPQRVFQSPERPRRSVEPSECHAP